MLFLDGVYLTATEPAVLLRIAPPSTAELPQLVQRIAERVPCSVTRLRTCATGSHVLPVGPGGCVATAAAARLSGPRAAGACGVRT